MISNVEGALKKHGWFVSSDKIEELLNDEETSLNNNNNSNNVDDLIKTLLDLDLNAVGLQPKGDSNKQKAETVCGPLVLQIQKVRNVSAPKVNETSHTAPQLLKVTVTDGSSTYQILQMGKWTSVSLDTPPGTKVQLKSGNTCKIVCGFLPLKQNQFSVIGGNVHGLIEKWQMTKVYGLNNRQRDSRAPKWVPFGHKITNTDLKDSAGGFKSLEQDTKTVKENEAFDQQRQANIDEIAKAFNIKKKSFGKNKPPVAEVPSERVPVNQRRSDQQLTGRPPARNDLPSEPSTRGRYDRKPNPRREEREDLPTPSAPSKPTTLFDFLTNKLGDGDSQKDSAPSAASRDYGLSDNSMHHGSGRSRDGRGGRSGGYGPPRGDGYGGRYHGDQEHNQHFSYKEDHPRPSFQNGDKVFAKYWEDQKMHRALITALGETGRTCVVRFVDYDNYEEVMLSDVQPTQPYKWDNFRPGGGQRPPRQQQQQQQQQHQHQQQQPSQAGRGGRGGRRGGGGAPHSGGGGPRAFDEGGNLNHNFSGSFEFRRGGAKPYVQQARGGGAGGGGAAGASADRGGARAHNHQQGRPERQFYQPPRQRRD